MGSFDYEDQRGEKTRCFNYTVEVSGPFQVELSEHDHYIWAFKDNLTQLSLTDSVCKILNAYWSR